LNLPNLVLTLAGSPITWVRIEHAKLDIVGLVLGAFNLAGALVLTAFGLGALLGFGFIMRARRAQPWENQVRLDLDPALDVTVR
jgi:hypothetical protein